MPEPIITPAADAPATAEAPVKIEYSPEQQAHINKILKDAMGRAAAAERGATAQLQRELDVLKAQQTTTPDLTTELQLTKAERDYLKKENQQAKLDIQLRAAASTVDFYDQNLGVRLMGDHVRTGPDGHLVVVNEDGTPMLSKTLAPVTLAELAQRVGDQHAYLIKGQVKGGAGSTPSAGRPSTPRPTPEEVFKSANSGAIAHKLSHENPQLYREIRAEAVAAGILPR